MINLLAALALIATPKPMDSTVRITAVPTAWQLVSYPQTGDLITFFVQGSPCPYQQVGMPGASYASDERNRYLSLMMTAKELGKQVFVDYETTSGSCRITAYGLNPN